MKEITKLDHKYLVFKWEDIQELPLEIKEKVAFIQGYIETFRHSKGKKDNKYLVLNLDDKLDIDDLIEDLTRIPITETECVNDISVHLVNAILKMKEMP